MIVSSKQSLVSVLIPAYNCSSFIGEAVKSVLEQSYNNIEILICDDCSSDGTDEILMELKQKNSGIGIIRNTKNMGYLDTFNRLLYEANGDYISFLDADDYLHKDKIRLQVEAFNKDPNLGLCGCNFISVSKTGKRISQSNYPSSDLEIREQMRYVFCFCGSSVMIKKEVRDTLGGYRSFFKGCVGEDVDWINRIMEQFKVYNINLLGYYYRFHANSLTRKVHFSIKQRHIYDIIYYLKKQRSETGNDFISLCDSAEYEKIINQLSSPYKIDKALLYKRIVIEYSINKDKKSAMMYMKRLCKLSGFSWVSVKVWLLMMSLLYIDYDVLIFLKRISGVSHISSRI